MTKPHNSDVELGIYLKKYRAMHDKWPGNNEITFIYHLLQDLEQSRRETQDLLGGLDPIWNGVFQAREELTKRYGWQDYEKEPDPTCGVDSTGC